MKPRGKNEVLRIAIVGGGPRGLAAAEALAGETWARPVQVTMFEPHPFAGAGPNYAPDQTPLNLLNIPLRFISVPVGPGGEDFREWLAVNAPDVGEDDYPPRALVGRYLGARFAALAAAATSALRIDVVAQRAVNCRRVRGGWLIWTDAMSDAGPFDEVLLCPGHQPVEDDQIGRWRTHAAGSGGVLAEAYPSEGLPASADWRGRIVGIRGFGLAMIDVTRVLTEGLGGRFEARADGSVAYRASGGEPARLVPFSLDGMPPAPKPETAAADAAYRVTEGERAALRQAVDAVIDKGDGSLEPVFAMLCRAAARILGGREADVLAWLRAGAKDDPDVPDDERPGEAMARYLAMARAQAGPSIGYAVGQIWRHLQNDLRVAYNPREKPPAAAGALVGFDDGMKRFSYGPPAGATARLLGLIEAGILTLRRVDDPDIRCVQAGWRIAEDGDADVASVMIDSVLAGPDISSTASPLLSGLLEEGLISQLDDKLGARTLPDAQVLDTHAAPVPGLSMLGRMATGSVIATDSLHDCFGAAVARWSRRMAGG